MWNKIEEFMDSYVYFFDCGVRAWLMYSAITFGLMALYLLGLVSKDICALVTFTALFPLVALWSRDFALGYVPVWWLKLGDKAYR